MAASIAGRAMLFGKDTPKPETDNNNPTIMAARARPALANRDIRFFTPVRLLLQKADPPSFR